MLLEEYCKKMDLNDTDCAKALGVHRETFRLWRLHQNVPSEKHMVAIYIWSGGAVEPNSFYDLPDLQSYPQPCADETVASSSKGSLALHRSSAQASSARPGKNFQYDLDHLCQAGVTA